jgi:electron transport complex protein RnfB
MSEETTRRQMLARTVRGMGLLGLGGVATYLATRSSPEGCWQIDWKKCINSRLGDTDAEVCESCMSECVVALSAVRVVNDFSRCGRCYICPGYFDVTSDVNDEGLPSRKVCPRDAIKREPIGYVDPEDPANNFYEYTIDEELCDGCGRCVMECKEPAGLGSLRLEVRHNLCLDCNRCAIAEACPHDAYVRAPMSRPPGAPEEPAEHA